MPEFFEPHPEELEPILPIEVDLLEDKHRRRLLFSRTDHGTKGNNGSARFIELPTKKAWRKPISVSLDELQIRDEQRMRREGEEAIVLGFTDYLADSDPKLQEAEPPHTEEELTQ